MTRGSLAFFLVLSGCGGRVEPEYGGGAAPVSYAAECADEPTPPTKLECTGLYDNLRAKALAEGVLSYAPAVPLWSDGAEKKRFILLPKGQKIDASDPDEWKFPVGTKVWKEFSVGKKRVETRFFLKTPDKRWVRTTYAWNKGDTVAQESKGGDVEGPDGNAYHIPTPAECDQCHRGRTDRLLGFEQVLLGLDGATGTTLADLVKDRLISPAPESTSLEIGDDGTGLAAPALGWLHVNCGVTCHNANSGAIASGANMRLKLDPSTLDGRKSNGLLPITTTVGVMVHTPTWNGQTRIVPGDPDSSLLVTLIKTRVQGSEDPNSVQMPPIASRLVDGDAVKKVIDWIAAMPKDGTESGTGPVDSTGTGNGGVR
jgi:hypothetical protein